MTRFETDWIQHGGTTIDHAMPGAHDPGAHNLKCFSAPNSDSFRNFLPLGNIAQVFCVPCIFIRQIISLWETRPRAVFCGEGVGGTRGLAQI